VSGALFFDLDGTLAETDHLHFLAMREVLADEGVAIDWPIYRARILGGANADIAARFLPHLPVACGRAALTRKEALYRARLLEDPARTPRAAGLTAFLAFAQERGLRCALVSNAPRDNAQATLTALGLVGRFDPIVLGDELPRGKPDPLPYLEALRLTGADPARSLAFEDSATGVRAAVGAGLATVGVGASAEPEALIAAGAVLAVRDFADARVMALVRERLGL
jgi:HAD superfamily hydrolase (TIGR01509 family)